MKRISEQPLHTSLKRTKVMSSFKIEFDNETKLKNLLIQRLPFHHPDVISEISKTIPTMSVDSGVHSVILTGPCFTGKTRTIDSILLYLHLLRIMNEDLPSERKIYSKENFVYRNGNSFAGDKRFSSKDRNELHEEIIHKLKPLYETDSKGNNYKTDCEPTGIYIFIDEMDSAGVRFCNFILGDLLENLPMLKKSTQFAMIIIATNIGGKELSNWCEQNPFDYCQAHKLVTNIFNEYFHFKIMSRLPKIIVCPPFSNEQIQNILKSVIITYLRQHLDNKVELYVSSLLTTPKQWDYQHITGLRPVKQKIYEVCRNLCKNLFKEFGPDIPDNLTLNTGPVPGFVSFWKYTNGEEHQVGQAVKVFTCDEEHMVQFKNKISDMGFPISNRLLMDFVTIGSKSTNFLSHIKSNIQQQLEQANPSVVVPLRTLYDTRKSELTVFDNYLPDNGKRVIVHVNLVKMFFFTMLDTQKNTRENKTRLDKNRLEIQELQKRFQKVEDSLVNENHLIQSNNMYLDRKNKRWCVRYWCCEHNKHKVKVFSFKKYKNKHNAKRRAKKWKLEFQ